MHLDPNTFSATAGSITAWIGVTGFLVGLIVGLMRSEGVRSLVRAVESAALGIAGGLVSRVFIGWLLGAGGSSPSTAESVGWGFLLWPGLDTFFGWVGAAPSLSRPENLLNIAMIAGGGTGLMDGAWKIHRWKGLGLIRFFSDVTWGLAGSTNGVLFHIFNITWARHANEPRTEVHRYEKGFRFKGGFAVTQGSVQSNMGSSGPGTPLFLHESIHVFQNRIFGPFFILSYLGWMAIWLVPAVAVACVSRRFGVSDAVMYWCYYNNPWEVWAYSSANPTARAHPNSLLCWSRPVAIAAAIAFFLLFAWVALAIIKQAW